MELESKQATVEAKAVNDAEGIVEAVVSVTNIVDNVKDVIVPGAYEDTLQKRVPKGVWSHDTTVPVARTVKAEELSPGDDRLPEHLRAQDAGGAYIKTYLKRENIIVYEEKYIHTWPMHPYDPLIELIKKNKWDKLNIGVEMDSHYFTAYCYEKLKKGLPNAKIKDSERLVNWARLVKSNAEINLMKGAAQISQLGMKVAMESINPGVRQCDAVGEIQKALFNGTKEFGGDYARIATLLPTGKGSSASHLTATEDKFVKGEATIIEISGVHKRYHCPMARTVLIGEKNKKKIDTMEAKKEAVETGTSNTKQRKQAAEVARNLWGVLDKHRKKNEKKPVQKHEKNQNKGKYG